MAYFSLCSLSLLPLLFMMLSCEHLEDKTSSCTCIEKNGIFKDCRVREPEWREHWKLELFGDCLPHVEANTMRCFRWRTGDECGKEQQLKCSLRHRPNQDRDISTNQDSTEAYFFSPGYDRTNPGYYNKNFCLYNISLDCPDNLVEITPNFPTDSLSDGETCTDYLSFHVDSQQSPVIRLCGDSVTDPTSYRPLISSPSFHAVLFSDDNGKEKGRFSLTAKCYNNSQHGSGVGMI